MNFDHFLATVTREPYRARWNGQCNALEVSVATLSGLMDCSDIDQPTARAPARFPTP